MIDLEKSSSGSFFSSGCCFSRCSGFFNGGSSLFCGSLGGLFCGCFFNNRFERVGLVGGFVSGCWVVDRGMVVSGGGFVVNWGRVVSGFGGRFVNWGRGGFVRSWVRGGLVSGFGGGFVSWLFWVGSFTFVFDISDITIGSSRVRHNLDTAIGKIDTVFTSGIIVVSGFSLGEHWAIMRIIYTVLVVVYWGSNGFSITGSWVRGMIRGWWGMIGKGRSGSNGQKGREGHLEIKEFRIVVFTGSIRRL